MGRRDRARLDHHGALTSFCSFWVSESTTRSAQGWRDYKQPRLLISDPLLLIALCSQR